MALLVSVAPSVVSGPVIFRDAEMALFQRLGQGVPFQWVLSSQLGVDTPVVRRASTSGKSPPTTPSAMAW